MTETLTTTEIQRPAVVTDWASALVNEMCQLEKPLRGEELALLKAQVAALRCEETPRVSVPADPTLPTVIRDIASLEQLAQALRNEPTAAIDLETSSLDHRAGEIVGVGFAAGTGVYYVPTAHRVRETHKLQPDQLPLPRLADAIDFERTPLIAHNAKFELKWLRHHLGIRPNFVWDTQIAARLLRSDKPSGLKELEYRYGPRSVLHPGDRFRIRGGPVYVTGEGEELPMHERGTFVFCRYFEQRRAKWLQAYKIGGGGVAILWVGASVESPVVSAYAASRIA